MNKKERINKKLIVSPHIDDDVLGCGGIIDENSVVLYCGANESEIPDRPSSEIRLKEAQKVSAFLGNEFILLDNKVNNYALVTLISQIEKHINQIQPEEIYLPHPSYNQDHRTVHAASITALRPHDKNYFVKKVMIYEQPHVFLWDHAAKNFIPNYFAEIDVDKKIQAYQLMQSQVRSFRGSDMIRSLAQLRGSQSNFKFAEAFQILRWIQ